MTSILILEDDYELAIVWRRALVSNGHEVEIVGSSTEAVINAERIGYDLYIVDLVLAKYSDERRDSGRNFLRQVLNETETPISKKKFIGVTGFKPKDTITVTRSIFELYGIQSILFKPFEARELVELVETRLKALQ